MVKTIKQKMIEKIKTGWVNLELRKGVLMREIWEIEARQQILSQKLQSYGELERVIQESTEMDEMDYRSNRINDSTC